MKGILLAGGSGTRLAPMTSVISKQLLPIYDKPMLYYPLSVLMQAGIREVMVISTPHDLPLMQKLLGDGSQWGIALSYMAQPKPAGIAQGFILAADFIGDSTVCMVLGDNIFYGEHLTEQLEVAARLKRGGHVFAIRVKDANRYGVVEINDLGNAVSIEEKPQNPKSPFALTGLYFFDNDAVKIAKSLKPSARGELEVVDICRIYMEQERLVVTKLNRGTAWLDTGTPESLIAAGQFMQTIEQRQGQKVACLEEIALQRGYITEEAFATLAQQMSKNDYGIYLQSLLAERKGHM